MATVTLHGNVKQFKAFLETLGDEFPKVAIRGIRVVGNRLADDYVKQEIDGQTPPPIDQRSYRDDWEAHDTVEGCEVGNPHKHATTVEIGQPPGLWVSYRALVGWCERHGMTPPTSAAKNIQRAIFNRGLKPRLPLKKALVRFRSSMGKDYVKAFKFAMKAILHKEGSFIEK